MVSKTKKNKNITRSKNKNRNGNRNKSRKTKRVKIFFVNKTMTDEKIEDKEGEYFNQKHYKNVINYNADCYRIDDDGKKHLLLKFRKGVIPNNLCKIGMKCLKKAAQKTHDNRGASAGVINMKKMPSYANDPKLLVGRNKFRVKAYISKRTGKLVTNSLGNISKSNIIGYFDKRDRNLGRNAPPCRTTAFTSQEVDKWNESEPLILSINKQFKKLIPDRYKIQYKKCRETPWFIKNTAFSTITINYNWRTALHKDAGDLDEGFGNLVVLEEGEYDGGCTGFPQYGVCVDVRNGDFLGMDVHEWHCNTEIKPISKDYSRLSMVSYLRKNMAKCKGMKIPLPDKKL